MDLVNQSQYSILLDVGTRSFINSVVFSNLSSSLLISLLFIMATRTRTIKPIRRYGFDLDETNDELSSENESAHSDSSVSDSDSESEDEQPNEPPPPNLDWNFVTSDSDARTHPLPAFIGNGGLQIPMPENPVEFALQILDEEVFTNMANWMNSRAAKRYYTDINKFGERKHTVKWTDVTSGEMKKLFGLILVTGLVKKPWIREYYSNNVYIATPFFNRPDTFSRDRFCQLLSNLRFADYSGEEPLKMAKIDPLIQLLRRKIQAIYKIDGIGTIDEFLVLYKGRLYMKQYIPKKRSRFGIKGFSLNEASTAYTFDVEIYAGRDSTEDWCRDIATFDELSVSEKIVAHMLNRSEMLDKWFSLAIDNWFCSYRLASKLLERNTMCMGTIRTARGVPKKLCDVKQNAITSTYLRKDDIIIVKYTDKRDVYVLSSVHTASSVTKERVNKNRERIEYQKPQCIEDYNHFMNGTDRVDQMMSAVSCARKAYVWPKKLGIHLLHRLGATNGYILAKKYFPRQMARKTFYQYELDLIEFLFRLAEVPNPRRRPIAHALEKIPATQSRPRPSLRCKQCRKTAPPGGRVSETRYRCGVCLDHPPLHMGCFQAYHDTL